MKKNSNKPMMKRVKGDLNDLVFNDPGRARFGDKGVFDENYSKIKRATKSKLKVKSQKGGVTTYAFS